jgi:aryl-alcohol dehydrogenase-like predicted oxidoreductase
MTAATMVHDIAAAKHARFRQIALAWLLQKGDDIVPISGTKYRKYLEENGAAEALPPRFGGDERARRCLGTGKGLGETLCRLDHGND